MSNEKNGGSAGENVRGRWVKPKLTVMKVQTPPAWSSCSSGTSSSVKEEEEN